LSIKALARNIKFSKLPKTKKTSSKEEVFVPGAGVL
jgi:hypothetical protein